jgi:Protein of unknown function (DUF3102)
MSAQLNKLREAEQHYKKASLLELASQIKSAHRAVGQAMLHAIEAGKLLLEAKKQVPHGEWLSWLETSCDMPERTAQAYMRIARNLGQLDQPNTQRVAYLSVRDALRMFSRTAQVAKVLPPPQFEAVLTETEETNDTNVISDVARRRVDEIRRGSPILPHPIFISAPPSDYVPPPRPPGPVELHSLLLRRLHDVVAAYRAEHEIDNGDILTIINEFYCQLGDGREPA